MVMVVLLHGLVWPGMAAVGRRDHGSSRGAGGVVLAAVVPAMVALLHRLVWPGTAAVQGQNCGSSGGASGIVLAAVVLAGSHWQW